MIYKTGVKIHRGLNTGTVYVNGNAYRIHLRYPVVLEGKTIFIEKTDKDLLYEASKHATRKDKRLMTRELQKRR